MKNKLSVLMVVIVFLTVLSVVPSKASPIPYTDLKLLTNPDSIIVGDTFDLEVWAHGEGIGQDLIAFGFNVSFAGGSYFSYDSYAMGSGFSDDSFGVNNVAGSVNSGIKNDDVLLATLSLTAIREGADILNVLGVYDASFSGLFYQDDGFHIIAPLALTSKVPLPSTIILLGTGLFALVAARKRFSNI